MLCSVSEIHDLLLLKLRKCNIVAKLKEKEASLRYSCNVVVFDHLALCFHVCISLSSGLKARENAINFVEKS